MNTATANFDQEQIQEMEEAILDFANYNGMYSEKEGDGLEPDYAKYLNEQQRVYLAHRAVTVSDYDTSQKNIVAYYEESMAQQVFDLHKQHKSTLDEAMTLING